MIQVNANCWKFERRHDGYAVRTPFFRVDWCEGESHVYFNVPMLLNILPINNCTAVSPWGKANAVIYPTAPIVTVDGEFGGKKVGTTAVHDVKSLKFVLPYADGIYIAYVDMADAVKVVKISENGIETYIEIEGGGRVAEKTVLIYLLPIRVFDREEVALYLFGHVYAPSFEFEMEMASEPPPAVVGSAL